MCPSLIQQLGNTCNISPWYPFPIARTQRLPRTFPFPDHQARYDTRVGGRGGNGIKFARAGREDKLVVDVGMPRGYQKIRGDIARFSGG